MVKNEGMLRDGALDGKVIVVTGGGTGLGRSMGEYFLALGAKLVITSRRGRSTAIRRGAVRFRSSRSALSSTVRSRAHVSS